MATFDIKSLANDLTTTINSIPVGLMLGFALPPALWLLGNIVEGSWSMAPSEAMVVVSLLGTAGFIGQILGSQSLKQMDRQVYLPEVLLPVGLILAVTAVVVYAGFPPRNNAVYTALQSAGLL